MDFTLTDDERAVIDAGLQVAGAADPWAALADGGWLDILLEDERGLGYLGFVYNNDWEIDVPGPRQLQVRNRSLALKVTYWLSR